FIIELCNRVSAEERFMLVKEKNEQDGTLMVIPLSQANIFLMFAGIVPPVKVIGKNDFFNVYPTTITDSMCHERDGLPSYCSICKDAVYKWPEIGVRNYHVSSDGLCQHIDCSTPNKNEPLS
ncbi:MAG: hypothetical protein U1A25_01495, partial [Candidatus Sungbacteria bacterium]|nr:hypothetical protein [Candidatus Sungbacteria bacterium]